METLWEKILAEGAESDRATEALRLVIGWAKSKPNQFYGRHEVDKDREPIIPRNGWLGRWDKPETGNVLAVFPHTLEAFLSSQGFDAKAIKRLWVDRGWLDHREGKNTKEHRMGKGGKSPLISFSQKAAEIETWGDS